MMLTQIRDVRNLKLWARQIQFWRTHLDVFIEEYFHIRLKDTQRVVARQFGNADTLMVVKSRGYTDMRKQIDGLAALVQTQFGQEMDETSLYLFCGRRADRIKALYWDGTGYILLYKRLTEKRFQWPRNEAELKKLTQQEFRWLMEGLSITQTKAFVPGKPGTVC